MRSECMQDIQKPYHIWKTVHPLTHWSRAIMPFLCTKMEEDWEKPPSKIETTSVSLMDHS